MDKESELGYAIRYWTKWIILLVVGFIALILTLVAIRGVL